jgi:hypothetical protein
MDDEKVVNLQRQKKYLNFFIWFIGGMLWSQIGILIGVLFLHRIRPNNELYYAIQEFLFKHFGDLYV